MTSEESIKQGCCPNCGGAMRQWTEAEIEAEKADMGMAQADDFFDCCEVCAALYMPPDSGSLWATLLLPKGSPKVRP